MTIRAKVLLFAAVAIGLVCLSGAQLFYGVQGGQKIRERMVAVHERFDSYGQLQDFVWPYLNDLSQARRSGEDPLAIRRELEARVEAELRRIQASMDLEVRLGGQLGQEGERREFASIRDAMGRWIRAAEARVGALPAGTEVEPAVAWALYSDFERSVGQRIQAIRQQEHEELEQLRPLWDENARRGKLLAVAFPILCIVFVLGIALAIIVPLQRALRALLKGAERLGQGEVDVALPVEGRDELGTLARAFGQMATQLRDSLREKQEIIHAEEETVRERTEELAEANARLQESLLQLQATQEQLLFADRLASVGRIVAGVGHEINNPLAYILSNLRFVQESLRESPGAVSEEEQQERLSALEEASDGAELIRVIVQDLKTLSRPDDMSLGAVELATVVRSAAKMVAHEVRHRARLVQECDGVPPVRANAVRLGQVFLNLFINAAHAITPGQVEQNEIRVRARVEMPGFVTVEVRDTGCGIPPEYLGRIFDPFFTTKPIGVGTGLGLSVCQRLITDLGGELRVESEPGRGTTFRITLLLSETSGSSGQAVA